MVRRFISILVPRQTEILVPTHQPDDGWQI
jgi:hypothetical protein